MSECDLRRILHEVICDIDAGRVDPRPRRRRLSRWLGPPLVAATIGITGAAGCDSRAVGTQEDAALDAGASEVYGVVPSDARIDTGTYIDTGIPTDSGNVDLYGMVIEDAGLDDAQVDSGNVDLYGVPLYGAQ